MREAGKILAYVLAVAVGGALLAPPLFWLGRWAVESGLVAQLAPFDFHKYLNRSVLLVALLLIWPLFRWLGIGSWRELQLDPNPRRWHDLALGVAIGVTGLWLVAGLLLFFGQASWRDPIPWGRLGAILATAVAVPIIEEGLFRGVLFGVLRRSLRWPVALAFLSAVFAALHFVKPAPGRGKMMEASWTSGLEVLPRSFWQFGEPQLVVGGLLVLFLVGWVLGLSVVRTRSLYFAIGLHGGWVFALRSFAQLTRRHGSSIWVGRDLITGLVPLVLLLVTVAVTYRLLRNRGAAAQAPEAASGQIPPASASGS